jgi:hypothetical protein
MNYLLLTCSQETLQMTSQNRSLIAPSATVLSMNLILVAKNVEVIFLRASQVA